MLGIMLRVKTTRKIWWNMYLQPPLADVSESWSFNQIILYDCYLWSSYDLYVSLLFYVQSFTVSILPHFLPKDWTNRKKPTRCKSTINHDVEENPEKSLYTIYFSSISHRKSRVEDHLLKGRPHTVVQQDLDRATRVLKGGITNVCCPIELGSSYRF